MEVMDLSKALELEICAGPSDDHRRHLIELPSIIVSEQGLCIGGHPRMSERPGRPKAHSLTREIQVSRSAERRTAGR
jgi:hypothetical protein